MGSLYDTHFGCEEGVGLRGLTQFERQLRSTAALGLCARRNIEREMAYNFQGFAFRDTLECGRAKRPTCQTAEQLFGTALCVN